MAITHVVQTNFIHDMNNELKMYVGPGNATFNSGAGDVVQLASYIRPNQASVSWVTNRSFEHSVNSGSRGVFHITTQIQSGYFFISPDQVDAGINHNLFILPIDGTYSAIRINGSTREIQLIILGNIEATIPFYQFTTLNQWKHLSINYFANPATGFVSFYIDGNQELNFNGNTGNQIDGVFFGGSLGSNDGYNPAYINSFYVNDTVGEPDTIPPVKEFHYLPVDSQGFYNDWTPNGAATNLEAVDDTPTDNETTYSLATNVNEKQSFILQTIPADFIPPNHSVNTVAPVAWARKTDSLATTTKLGLRQSTGDEQYSADKPLAIDYELHTEPFDTDANSNAWDGTNLPGLEVVIEATGAI